MIIGWHRTYHLCTLVVLISLTVIGLAPKLGPDVVEYLFALPLIFCGAIQFLHTPVGLHFLSGHSTALFSGLLATLLPPPTAILTAWQSCCRLTVLITTALLRCCEEQRYHARATAFPVVEKRSSTPLAQAVMAYRGGIRPPPTQRTNQ